MCTVCICTSTRLIKCHNRPFINEERKPSICVCSYGYKSCTFLYLRGLFIIQGKREKKNVICFTVVLGYHHSGTCQHCYGRNVGRLSEGIKTGKKGNKLRKRDADNGLLWPSAAWLSLWRPTVFERGVLWLLSFKHVYNCFLNRRWRPQQLLNGPFEHLTHGI